MALRSESNNNRNQYYDFLRDLAIVAVIGIHSYNTSYTNIIELFCREALNFSVPLFLVISAFFLSRKKFNDRGEFSSFLKKQISKVYIPCLIWSLPLLLLDNKAIYIRLLIFFTCGYSIYYYILLTIQFYIGLPLFQRLNNRFIILFAVIQIISTIGISYYTLFKGINLPLTIDGGICLLWISFYFMGVILARSYRAYSLKIPLFLILIGILLSVIETQWLVSHTGGGFGANKLSSYIYSTGILMLLFSPKLEAIFNNSENKFKQLFSQIGNMSFGIYLTHLYFINILRHFRIDNWGILWLSGLIMSACSIIIARKVLPDTISRYLGFR